MRFKYVAIKFNGIDSKRIVSFFSCILFRILMDWYYLDYVSPNWGYMDMEININTEKMLISYAIIIALIVLIDWESDEFSGVAIQTLFLVMIVPLTSSYALNNQSTLFTVCCVFSFAVSALLVRQSFEFKLLIKIWGIAKKDSKCILQIIIIGMLLYIVIIIMPRGFNVSVLNIFNSELIYGMRGNGIVLSRVWAYLYIWAYRIIIPVFGGYFLNKKKYGRAAIIFGIQLLIYLSDPHKEILLGMLLIIGLFFCGKKKKYGKLLLGGFTCAIGGGMFFYKLFESKIAFYGLNILMRVFHIPASIKFQHFRFFSQTSKLYFSEGRIGRLLGVAYPYGNMSVGRVVAQYLRNSTSNNNAGYLAYAYDDLGYIGIFLAGILLAVIFRVFDIYIADKNRKWIVAVAIYPIIGLNDTPLLQWMLSGGGIILLFLLWIIDCSSKTKQIDI